VDGRLDSGSGATWLFLLPVHPIFNAALLLVVGVKVVFLAPCHCIGQNVTFQSTKNETENRSKKAVPSNFVINFLLLCHGMRVFKVTFFKCVKDTHVRDENRAAQLHIMKNVAYKQPRSRDSVLIASRRIC
jgi:hypothetical protein